MDRSLHAVGYLVVRTVCFLTVIRVVPVVPVAPMVHSFWTCTLYMRYSITWVHYGCLVLQNSALSLDKVRLFSVHARHTGNFSTSNLKSACMDLPSDALQLESSVHRPTFTHMEDDTSLYSQSQLTSFSPNKPPALSGLQQLSSARRHTPLSFSLYRWLFISAVNCIAFVCCIPFLLLRLSCCLYVRYTAALIMIL
jgi:hypothetical protein